MNVTDRGDELFLSEADLEDVQDVDAEVDDENSDVSEESLVLPPTKSSAPLHVSLAKLFSFENFFII